MSLRPLSILLLICLSSLPCQARPGQPVEARGIWIDSASIPTNDDEVRRLIDRICQANMNIIFPEVFRRGYSTYPSSFAVQDPRWRGFDPLSSIIRQAHRRGIEVHAWVNVFRQGYSVDKGPILTSHPEWIARDRLGRELTENGSYWVCPSNMAARHYLTSIFEEILSRYELDGIHLDYIRFEDQEQTPHCYDDNCRREFRGEYGIDPVDIDPLSPDQIRWHMWRERLINTFMQSIALLARSLRPGIKVSAAVGADPIQARLRLLQNWVNWMENRWVDFVCPMAYTADNGWFLRIVSKGMEAVPPGSLLFPGIGIINHKDPAITLQQIAICREIGALGEILFSAHYFREPWQEALKTGPFDQPALLPLKNPNAALAMLPPESREARALKGYIDCISSPTRYVPPVPPPIFIPDCVLPIPEVTAARAHYQITVDGRLEEEDWNRAAMVDLLHTNLGAKAPVRTAVRLLYGGQSLYIVFIASEPELAKVKAEVTERDGAVFYDDSIEIFLDPNPSAAEFYHFSANTIGTLFDSRDGKQNWNAPWRAAATRAADCWVMEVEIPFSFMGSVAPKSGDLWRANFARNRTAGGALEHITWSVPYGSFHRRERFGLLRFE